MVSIFFETNNVLYFRFFFFIYLFIFMIYFATRLEEISLYRKCFYLTLFCKRNNHFNYYFYVSVFFFQLEGFIFRLERLIISSGCSIELFSRYIQQEIVLFRR